eukprot:m.86223 g.86223  ORF g.86223 m.86223 type:complete len:57 (-) comp50913_c0_seq1:175-345(-)
MQSSTSFDPSSSSQPSLEIEEQRRILKHDCGVVFMSYSQPNCQKHRPEEEQTALRY